ncbi:MAG: DUF4192 family protein [Microbacterium sp.]
MTTTLRATSSQSFLSYVPHMCGFVPRESLVLIPIVDGHTTGAMRIDLPRDPKIWPELAADAMGLICRMPDVRGLSLVIYTDDPLVDAAGDLAWRGFADYLLERADDCGLRTNDALCVASDAWGSFFSPDAEARDLGEIDYEGAIPDELGSAPIGVGQLAGVALPEVDLAQTERVGRAILAVRAAMIALALQGHAKDLTTLPALAIEAGLMLQDPPPAFEMALDWKGPLEEHFAAMMIVALNGPPLRDVALTQWAGGVDEGYETLALNRRWADGDQTHPDGPVRLMGQGSRPSRARLEKALELVRQCAALAPTQEKVGPLAAAAWLSWGLGSSTRAEHYAKEVLKIDRSHGLAEIVMTFIANSYLPPWAFAPA